MAAEAEAASSFFYIFENMEKGLVLICSQLKCALTMNTFDMTDVNGRQPLCKTWIMKNNASEKKWTMSKIKADC